MKAFSSIAITCPGCGTALQVPVEVEPEGRTALVVSLDYDAFLPQFEQHVLDNPQHHSAFVVADGEPGKDEATADTSEPYFLDLIARIDREVEA